jgi:hypothetical protein
VENPDADEPLTEKPHTAKQPRVSTNTSVSTKTKPHAAKAAPRKRGNSKPKAKTPKAEPGSAPKPKREDQRMFDCLCAIYGQESSTVTDQTRSRFNRAIGAWRKQGIDHETMARAVDLYIKDTSDKAFKFLSQARLDEWIGKVRAKDAEQSRLANLGPYFTTDGRLKQVLALTHLPEFENADHMDPETWPENYRRAVEMVEVGHGN